MASEQAKAYAAGIVDGEGYIYCLCRPRRNKRTALYQYGVRVKMLDLAALLFLQDNFGGKVKPTTPSGRAKRLAFRWEASTRKGVSFLVEILPYLQIKKRDAELVIQLAALIKRRPVKGEGRNYVTDSDRESRGAIIVEFNSVRRNRKMEVA